LVGHVADLGALGDPEIVRRVPARMVFLVAAT
jgi:hypothetical protein